MTNFTACHKQHFLPIFLMTGFSWSAEPEDARNLRKNLNTYAVSKRSLMKIDCGEQAVTEDVVFLSRIENLFFEEFGYTDNSLELDIDNQITKEERETISKIIKKIQNVNSFSDVSQEQFCQILSHYLYRSIKIRLIIADVYKQGYSSYEKANLYKILRYNKKLPSYDHFLRFLSLIKNAYNSTEKFKKDISEISQFVKHHQTITEDYLKYRQLSNFESSFQLSNELELNKNIKQARVVSGFENLFLSDCGYLAFKFNSTKKTFDFIVNEVVDSTIFQKYDGFLMAVSSNKLIFWSFKEIDFNIEHLLKFEAAINRAYLKNTDTVCISKDKEKLFMAIKKDFNGPTNQLEWCLIEKTDQATIEMIENEITKHALRKNFENPKSPQQLEDQCAIDRAICSPCSAQILNNKKLKITFNSKIKKINIWAKSIDGVTSKKIIFKKHTFSCVIDLNQLSNINYFYIMYTINNDPVKIAPILFFRF